MNNQLDQYVEANLVKKKGTWYSIENEKLGQRTEAEAKLKELVEKGLVEKLGANETAQDDKPVISPPSMSMSEIDKGEKPAELLPVTKPKKPKVNPALTNQTELSKNIDDIFAPLAADIGDIESRKKGGRFKVFVFGIDSNLMFSNPKNLPASTRKILDKVPYVFRHCDKKTNVKSGSSTYNEGWKVLSKKLINDDPRTGKKWITVARDDTPDEDIFTVGVTVLCYADRAQFKRKKGKQAMVDILKTQAITDSRQEMAERMASQSGVDPESSIQGYMSANKADQSIAREQLEKNDKFSINEAQEYIDNMNTLGTREKDIDTQVAEMRKLVDAGKVGKTVISSKPLTMDEL